MRKRGLCNPAALHWPQKNLQSFCFLTFPLFLRWLQSDQSDKRIPSSSVHSRMKSLIPFWCIYLIFWKESSPLRRIKQRRRAAERKVRLPAGPAKYLLHCGTKGTFVLWVCVSPSQLLTLASNFPVKGCGSTVCQRNVSLDGPGQLYWRSEVRETLSSLVRKHTNK